MAHLLLLVIVFIIVCFNSNLFFKALYYVYVKTIKNWRDREKYLQELGLKDDLDFE